MDTPSDDTWLQLLEYNNSFAGRAVFACMWGHKLLGSQSIECKEDGSWSGAIPSCAGESRSANFAPVFRVLLLDDVKMHARRVYTLR